MIAPVRDSIEATASPLAQLTRRDALKAVGLGMITPELNRRVGAVPPAEAAGSLILLVMLGGASPWESFDPRPDAPSQLRGPFGSIATAVPGVRVAEHLPAIARRLDRLTLIRSVCHDAEPTHDAGLRLLMTGRSELGYPALGSIAALRLGARGGVPPFVVLPERIGPTGGLARYDAAAGSLGAAFDPFVVGVSASSPRFDPARLSERVRRWGDRAAARGLVGADSRPTYDLGRGWDWTAERRSVREQFGASRFGADCWLAGRFVAAGARVVVVPMAASVFDQPSWDAHGRDPFRSFDDYARTLLPSFDQGFAGLMDDLEVRDLLATTLVVATGEFGRTPWINESGGRDHWPGVWSALVAGGRAPGGQVVGASDRDGRPRDRPVPVAELVATMRHAIGLTSEDRVVAEVLG